MRTPNRQGQPGGHHYASPAGYDGYHQYSQPAGGAFEAPYGSHDGNFGGGGRPPPTHASYDSYAPQPAVNGRAGAGYVGGGHHYGGDVYRAPQHYRHEAQQPPSYRPQHQQSVSFFEEEERGSGGATPRAPQRHRATPQNRGKGALDVPMAPPGRASTSCTRATVVCIVVLCIAWPGMIVAGGILSATANPQQAQRDEFAAATANFNEITADVLLTTSAVTIAEPTVRQLTPAYQLLEKTPFPTVRTLVLHTADRYAVPETLGPNLGSVTARITYRQGEGSAVGQTFTFVSPPINLKRSARKSVFCTPPFASICGTQTCCTATEMQRQCTETVRAFSATSPVSFLPNGVDCRLGLDCGHCEYQQSVSDLCFVILWSALSGWSGDETVSSCTYPFLPTGQGYADSDAGATLTLRAADDPYIVLQRMTKGTLTLDDTGNSVRSRGRGLILFGVLTLLLGACVGILAKFCGRDVLTSDAIRRAFGVRKRASSDADDRKGRRHRQAHRPTEDSGPVGKFDGSDSPYHDQHQQAQQALPRMEGGRPTTPYHQEHHGGGGQHWVDAGAGSPDPGSPVGIPVASFRNADMQHSPTQRHGGGGGRRWGSNDLQDDEL